MADTLLDRAVAWKVRHSPRSVNDEEQELAMAWAQGAIGVAQASVALGHQRTSAKTYTSLALALRAAVQSGKLTVPHA